MSKLPCETALCGAPSTFVHFTLSPTVTVTLKEMRSKVIHVMGEIARPGSVPFVRGANVCARVVSAAGPWRRQGEWWAEGANGEADDVAGRDDVRATVASAPATCARDYYDLALADGGVYRVYCDLNSAKWFVDGMYD